MPTLHLLIKGKVQGVFYRASAKEVAEDLNLTGWIKNTPEGDVEAAGNGSPEALEQFVAWCRQGPPSARVTEVLTTEKEEEPFDGFHVIR